MKRQEIDIVLLREAKQGCQMAFSSLFSYYRWQVYVYIRSIVKNYTEAEDLTMITFEKAFANLSKYYPFFTFKAWLFKIAKNTAIDFIKYKKRNPEDVDIANLHYLMSEIENAMEREEEIQLIKKAVNQLDSKYKTVIELYYYEECSYKDISLKLHLPINTVCGQMYRAKLHLHKLIKNQAS